MIQNCAKNHNDKGSLAALDGRRIMFLLLMCAGLSATGLHGQDLSVCKGSSTKVAVADGIRKLTIGSDKIIDAKPQDDGHAALVMGLAEGCSDLRIERLQGPDLVYKVAVHSEFQGLIEQMKEMLSDVAG
jgi:hypothetical protein